MFRQLICVKVRSNKIHFFSVFANEYFIYQGDPSKSVWRLMQRDEHSAGSSNYLERLSVQGFKQPPWNVSMAVHSVQIVEFSQFIFIWYFKTATVMLTLVPFWKIKNVKSNVQQRRRNKVSPENIVPLARYVLCQNQVNGI